MMHMLTVLEVTPPSLQLSQTRPIRSQYTPPPTHTFKCGVGDGGGREGDFEKTAVLGPGLAVEGGEAYLTGRRDNSGGAVTLSAELISEGGTAGVPWKIGDLGGTATSSAGLVSEGDAQGDETCGSGVHEERALMSEEGCSGAFENHAHVNSVGGHATATPTVADKTIAATVPANPLPTPKALWMGGGGQMICVGLLSCILVWFQRVALWM